MIWVLAGFWAVLVIGATFGYLILGVIRDSPIGSLRANNEHPMPPHWSPVAVFGVRAKLKRGIRSSTALLSVGPDGLAITGVILDDTWISRAEVESITISRSPFLFLGANVYRFEGTHGRLKGVLVACHDSTATTALERCGWPLSRHGGTPIGP